jgi:hypothetical protein
MGLLREAASPVRREAIGTRGSPLKTPVFDLAFDADTPAPRPFLEHRRILGQIVV